VLAGLTLAVPGALALAALVPLIWWLHRARPHGEPLEVASLVLFRQQSGSPPSIEPRPADRPDRAWIRRALLVLALAGSLAGVHELTRMPPVVAWIDSSPSMQTREHGTTRLQTALADLDRELAGRGVTAVTLRSLAQADLTLRERVPFDARRVALRMPTGAPIFPEAAALDRSAEHWLVTDGTDDAVFRWLSAAPVAHIVPAGILTENAAVTLLAYRPSLLGNGCGDAIVTVYNAGRAASRRRLDLTAPPCAAAGSSSSAPPTHTDLTLQAGQTQTLHFTVGPPPLRIEASLAPADALPDDDRLVLEVTRPLTERVAVDPACGRGLEAAVQADPAVVAAPPRDAQLLVDCSLRWRDSALPRLIVRPAAGPQALVWPLRWHWRSGPRAEGRVVSGPAGRPLAVLRPGPPRTLETVLDLQDGEAAARSEYPLLVASLLDATAGEVLTQRLVHAAHAPADARIAPDTAALARWQRAHRGPRTPLASHASVDLTPAMLTLAVLLAVWELAVAARALAAVRRYYSGAPP
jgi:hypothetical protein